MSGVLSVLDQLKIAARNGEILDASQLERMLGPKEAAETSYTELIPDSLVFRNRFGISVSAKTPAQAELVKAVAPASVANRRADSDCSCALGNCDCELTSLAVAGLLLSRLVGVASKDDTA